VSARRPPVPGAAVADRLQRHGFDFFTGVPCSLIEDVIAALERRPRWPYVAAAREDLAIGLAGGAWLGGRRPAVLMQNSGLGTSLNALASFTLMYRLPVLLLVTWRGHGGVDAPEHILMGAISPRLLELLGVPFRVLASSSLDDDIAWAAAEMDTRVGPVALLVPPGVVAVGGEPASTAGRAPDEAAGDAALAPARDHLWPRMSRREALGVVVKELDDEPAIHANGYVCRESFSIADRAQNFYMIGSMGLACAIGLGIALTAPDRRTFVLDGDGNLLMGLGVLAMVTGLRPPNLVHVVFDNEVYGSTGNQPSASAHVRLDRVAGAAGYRTAGAVTRSDELAAVVQRALTSDGPHFILAKVTTEEAEVPRIPHTPEAIRDRFRTSLRSA
jgi:phosphonopyruvate decarboxylase